MATVMGVVGAGGISKFHFRAYAETGTAVRIVSDLRAASATAAAAPFGAECAGDWRDVVRHPEVTTVGVFTPTAMHYEVAKAALENGKHVVCEKTLTLQAGQSLELGRLAVKNGLCLYTNYMKRYFPAVIKAKELMPQLGHIMSVYCRTYQGVGGANFHTGQVADFFLPGPDGVSPVMHMSGGGILVCGGSHIFDLLLHLVGKPTRVAGRSFRREHADVDFMTHAMLDLPDGGVAHFEANWHPLTHVGFEQRGWDEGFEISGVDGRLIVQTPVWDQPECNAAQLHYYDNREGTWTRYDLPIVNPFIEAEKHYLSQLARNEQGPQDVFTGYRVDELLESTARSAKEGRPIEIEWKA